MQYDTKNQSAEHNCVKAQKVHTMRNATLNIIMWLLAFVLVLTIMAVLPMPNDNRINVNTALAQGVADDGTTAIAFAGGTGTEEDPYQIATPMQLRLLSETTDYATYWGSGTVSDNIGSSATIREAVYYELTANLELTSTGWTPIGSGDQVFFGYFDGQGHTITFVNAVNVEGVLTDDINYDSGGYLAGLFGCIAGGSINNLGVNWQGSLNVVDATCVGGLVARIVESNIINCHSEGSIIVTNNISGGEVGGILGACSSITTIEGCYNLASLNINCSSRIDAGGICGSVYGGHGGADSAFIRNCYNAGHIVCSTNGYSNIGGIAGTAGRTLMENCYNLGDIIGLLSTPSVGGILGSMSLGYVISCYNTGSITSNSFAAGIGNITMGSAYNCFSIEGTIKTTAEDGEGFVYGIAEENPSSAGSGTDIFNCYFDNELVGTVSNNDGQYINGLANLMKVESNFTDESFQDGQGNNYEWFNFENEEGLLQNVVLWDFEYVWQIDSNINNGYPYIELPIKIVPCLEISNEQELLAFAQNEIYWGGFAKVDNVILTDDIEVTTTFWNPIGNNENVYMGNFDGQGHTITFVNQVITEGVLTNALGDDVYLAGLFGYVAGGSISNLGVNWQGGLTVENNVANAGVYVGGIAGQIAGTLTNCYNTGSITASSESVAAFVVGGIAGQIAGTLTNCYNIGSISGTVSGENVRMIMAGGIAGVAMGTITNCYNIGSISGTGDNARMAMVGGIAAAGTGTIVNCFSIEGQITLIGTAQQMGVGGIMGMDVGDSVITNCYYDNVLTGTASTLDGTRVTGLADLMKVKSNFTNGNFVDSASTSHPWVTEPIQTTDPITQEPVEIQPQWDFENVWGIDSSINNGYPYLLNMSQGGTGDAESDNQVTITNGSEKAVLVVISSENSTVMFKVQGGTTKTYTMPIALDTTYKVSVIGGTITSVPTISGGEIIDQQGNIFNVTFTESGTLGIVI